METFNIKLRVTGEGESTVEAASLEDAVKAVESTVVTLAIPAQVEDSSFNYGVEVASCNQ